MATSTAEIFTIDGIDYIAEPTMEQFMKEAGIPTRTAKMIISAMKSNGITHYTTLFSLTRMDLENLEKVTTKTAVKLQMHIIRLRKKGSHVQGAESLRVREGNFKYIPTGSSMLDDMLAYSNGEVGWRTNCVVELYGEPAMGKTQIAHTASVMMMRPKNRGGLGRGVAYIDSEGAFEYGHYASIARYWDVNPDLLDKKFFYSRVMDFDEVELALDEIGKIALEKDIGMIVVDSIMDPLKAQYPVGGQELKNLQPRQKHLKRVIDKMKKMAEAYNMLIIYTNHVRANISSTPGAKPLDPQGGAVLGHASDIRIELTRPTKAQREDMGVDYKQMDELSLKAARAKIVDCGFLGENTGFYLIGPFGVSDPRKYDQVIAHAEKYKKVGYMSVNSLGESLPPPDANAKTRIENLQRNIDYLYGKSDEKEEVAEKDGGQEKKTKEKNKVSRERKTKSNER